jgi:16S rRNA G966 N2-methylase RsmD
LSKKKIKECCASWRAYIEAGIVNVADVNTGGFADLVRKFGTVQLASHCPVCGDAIIKARKRAKKTDAIYIDPPFKGSEKGGGE